MKKNKKIKNQSPTNRSFQTVIFKKSTLLKLQTIKHPNGYKIAEYMMIDKKKSLKGIKILKVKNKIVYAMMTDKIILPALGFRSSFQFIN